MQRYTVGEAAWLLGVGTDAIRKRIQRGTIETEFEDGTRYVLLAESETRRATGTDSGRDAEGSALVSEMRERIASLERQLEEERNANRKKGRLLAALERIPPHLEAPSEPRESPTEATEQPGRRPPRPQTPLEGAQEGTERTSWWRRMFGA